MFSYQSSLFSLPLSRDSYIRLSHPFLFVNHFFHLFSSNFCGGPSSQCGKAVLRIVTLRCFVLTVISGTCYIISSVLINVNFFFRLFLSFYHHSLCSHTNRRPKLYGLLVRRIFENKHRKTKQPFMILNPKSQSLPKKRSNLSDIPLFLYLPNLQQFLF